MQSLLSFLSGVSDVMCFKWILPLGHKNNIRNNNKVQIDWKKVARYLRTAVQKRDNKV